MRFILARHCQTNWNLQKRVQGHIDIPLNDDGRLQAKELAVKLRPFGITRIVSSTLSRATETAIIIARNLKSGLTAPIHFDDRLKECGYGRLEGLTHGQIDYAYGKQYLLKDRSKRNFDFSDIGGESRDEIRDRHLAIFKELAYQYRWDTILLVGHGGGLNVLLMALKRKPEVIQGGFVVLENI